MLNRTVVAALLIALPGCAQPGERAAPDPQADVEAIQNLLKEATAAHHAGDAERWAAVFASDAVGMPQGDTAISGREALLARRRADFEKYVSTATIEPLEIEVAGDWGFARTAVSGAFTPKDGGPPIQLDEKEIVIFRRQPDGSWKVARLIGNSNRPPRN
jgi:uncharacterized protein (TIGR02246 family)